MKTIFFRIRTTAFLLVFALTMISQPVCAQMSEKAIKKVQKTKDKQDSKQYKKKMAEYRKEGWKLAGSSRSLEVALLDHYLKLSDSNNKEFAGEVSQCKSINVCKQFALSNALNRYATLAGGYVKGRIENILRANADEPEEEIDKFIAAYENQVKAEVGGVLTESYSIVKDKGVTKEYKTFFILNEEQASVARKRAMERSLRETKISLKEAEEISKFVSEGFDLE